MRPIPDPNPNPSKIPVEKIKLPEKDPYERARTLEENLEKERQIDPNSYFFGFRGLIVRKFQQKLSVMNPEYSFVNDVDSIGFLEKFAANTFEDVVKDVAINKKDIPINIPPVYKKK